MGDDMKTAIAIRHSASEGLGSLEDLFRDRGFSVAYHEAGTDNPGDPALRTADLVVSLGGPMSANDEANYPYIPYELAALRARIAGERATLGICLGGQLMARALDATVRRMEAPEICWSRLSLLEAAQGTALVHFAQTHVVQWHEDTFDLPRGATLLASTAVCANQAFAIGKHALGLQFHPEITQDELEHWVAGDVEADVLRRAMLGEDGERRCAALVSQTRRFVSAWLSDIGL